MSFWSRWFARFRKTPAPVVVTPVVEAARLTMGVSVFCGWPLNRAEYGAVPGRQCPDREPWSKIQTADRQMALGVYDERDPAVTAQRLKWMQEGGVDYAVYQVEWAHRHFRPDLIPYLQPLDSPLLMAHCADNHVPDSPVRFCVSLWDVMASSEDANYWREMREAGWKSDTMEDCWRGYARAIATRYMARPNYLRVDGRPVLFEGYADSLAFYQREYGITPERVIAIMREEVLLRTGLNPYIVATATDPAWFPQLKAIGFDAFTEYLLYGDGWANTMSIYRDRWRDAIAICKATGIDYWVPTTCGYDSAAWGNIVRYPDGRPAKHMPTPAEFTAHLREARAFAETNRVNTRGFCCNYAMSEIGEGGILEPMKDVSGNLHRGDEMIRAHKAATA